MVHLKYKKDNGKIETRLTSWPWNKNESSRYYSMQLLTSIYSMVQDNTELSIKEAIEITQKNYMNDHIQENRGALDPNLEELIEKSRNIKFLREDEQFEILNKRELELERKGYLSEIFDEFFNWGRPHLLLLENLIDIYFKDKAKGYEEMDKVKYYIKLMINSRHDFELDDVDIEFGIGKNTSYIRSMSRRELYKDLNIDFPDSDEVNDVNNQENIENPEENNDLPINEEEVIF